MHIKCGPKPKRRNWRKLHISKLTRAERAMRFIESMCRVPEGKLVGQPIKLIGMQEDFIYAVLDNPHGTRRAYLSIARKNAKTATIACLLVVFLIGPEARLNSQILSGARSREQAGQVFNYASKIIQLSPQLSGLCKITPSVKSIIGLPMNVEYKASSAEAKTAMGGSPILAILDEVGQVRGPQDDFIDAITTSQGAHESPILIAISTQAADDADLFSVWLDDAEKSGDPRIVSHVYAAKEDAGLMDKAAWKAANPALGIFRSLEDLQEQARQASRMPTAENTFRNLCLNQRVSRVSPFVSRDVWESCNIEPGEMCGRDVYVGIDLSARTDLTAVVIISRDDDGGIDVWPTFFTPENGIRDRAKRDRAPYDTWRDMGHIYATPGATVDYEYVAQYLAEALAESNVISVAYDRWRIDVFKKACGVVGVDLPMVEYGQGYKDMAPAIDAFEAALLNGDIRHGGHPVLTMCAMNAIIIKDAAGNRKLDKAKSTGRIDGMVALAMAIGAINKSEDESGSFNDFINSPLRLMA